MRFLLRLARSALRGLRLTRSALRGLTPIERLGQRDLVIIELLRELCVCVCVCV